VRIEADLLGRRIPLKVVRVVVLLLGRHPPVWSTVLMMRVNSEQRNGLMLSNFSFKIDQIDRQFSL